jgi:hypothetical protein
MVLDLEDYLSKFKRHLDSVHTLSRDQQLADLYHTFEISPVASTERNEAFQTLKSMLQSTVNSSIESRTTILDKSGKVVVDDVDDHEEETCSSCHSLRDDVDVMTSKLKSAGVIIKQSKPTIEINFDRPASRQERLYTKVMENVIYRYNKRGWAISIERNIYSKLYDDMPTAGHSKLPIGHPSLPVETYICFTRAINTNRVTLKGENIIIKSYVKLPKDLLVKLSYYKP